jgi:hypothetical protein
MASRLKARGETIAVSESSSGGLVSAALLALPDMARAYLPHALGVEAVVSAEGNASAPAPTGTTAGAETTAGDAAPLA